MSAPDYKGDPYEGTQNLWTMPRHASVTMERAHLRAFLHATGGSIMAHGVLWDVKTKSLGAGVYLVSVKERKWKEAKR